MLVERKRLDFTVPLPQWLRDAASPSVAEIIPLTGEIAAETAAFAVPFHRDPADRIIVATSRVLGLPLATDDRRILRSRLAQRWVPE